MKKKTIGNQDGGYTPGREERWTEGIKFIFQQLAKKSGRDYFQILDVGCGDGVFYQFLKTKAENRNLSLKRVIYSGLDEDVSYRDKVEESGGRFIHGNVLNLAALTKGRKFDSIIASDIIEHIDQTDRFIDQLKLAVKSNGYIYLTTPNLAAWHCRLMLMFGFQPLPTEISNINSNFGKGLVGRKLYSQKTIHHIRVFTYKALKEFLSFHKLDIVKAVGSGYRKIEPILLGKRFISLAPLIIVILKNRSQKGK